MDPTDAELVRAARAGQRDAYGALVQRHARRVAAICWAALRRPQTRDPMIEDLVQETFLRGLRGLHSLEDPQHFGAWLAGIARHACADLRKARSRSEQTSEPDRAHSSERMETALQHRDADPGHLEDLARVRAEVLALPAHYRETLGLFYYGDRSYRAIAELQGVSEATVNVRLTRARALLRRRLAPEPESDDHDS